MRGALERVLDNAKLIAIAAAIALGFALLESAQAVGGLVESLFASSDDDFGGGRGGEPLTVHIGSRALSFGELLAAVTSLAVVVLVVALVLGRSGRRPPA